MSPIDEFDGSARINSQAGDYVLRWSISAIDFRRLVSGEERCELNATYQKRNSSCRKIIRRNGSLFIVW
jgi:hypothetical protein